ncbi:DUF885 domain-containing protein [Sphingomonas xanthus]|uniref:DUF885 domain-containing protein n=1 Tax=Sphingomonas xanthus TaxID=2594473 RepID=A0A516ITL2_9SPHN|nr:DUF885 domain-containing protein [Sphingomonas xanthus]QDP20248.1 DUF885 domain-containing protein [Sphingomonas xanthus]
MNDFSYSRRQALGALSAGVAGISLPGCAPTLVGTPGAVAGDGAANALIESFGSNLLRLSPEGATSLALDAGANADLRFKLADRSQAGQDQLAGQLRADLARAEMVDTASLSHSTRTSIEVVKSAYRTALEGFAQPYGDVAVGGWRNTPYVVIQNVGAYLDVPRFLDTDHQVKTAPDAEAYLSRLDSYAVQLDGELGRMKDAAAKGLIPPAFLLDKAIKQMDQALGGARKGGALVESLVRRTRNAGIAGNWGPRADAIVRGRVAPALTRQLDELRAQRGRATMDAGLWARPGGDAFYAWALKASTTTSMTPEEIHQMGLRELAELHGQMDPILRKIGYTQGSVGDRMNALAKDPRYKFSEGDKGRAEIMAYIHQYLDRWRKLTPQAFRTLVPARLEVKRLPPEEEPGAPSAYGGAGSPDGTIPGKYWINLRTTDLHSKYSLPDLTAHEAIPGHVWQGDYANRLPLIRTLLAFNAFSEGWALYAEQLVDELGGYSDFEVGRLGFLQSLAFRACRLVVDTGLHAKRWSREQGVQFFVEQNGSNPLEVASEVDRYCSWAGQACGYKVGHSEILRQRSRARQALSGAYDLRDFNDTLVKGGNVPLDVLARNVDYYIASARR